MNVIMRAIAVCIIVFTANMIGFKIDFKPVISLVLVVGFIFINCLPSIHTKKLPTRRLRICANGCELLIDFLISTTICIVYLIQQIGNVSLSAWLWNVVFVFLCECIVFWNGIIRVYMASVQLGMRYRVVGAVCGMIPIVNIIVLYRIIKVVSQEVNFESEKIYRNQQRKHQQICATKYPILMVHGVFFRDYKFVNYWGRIPKELEINGAKLYYGNHESAASIDDSAKELRARIHQIVKETGCEKVNIIAHSKGGLDSRCAISLYGMDTNVASLTTINTPHRGCIFAEYLLKKLPDTIVQKTANGYNFTLKKLGDKNPDFLAACNDLTASHATAFNEIVKDKEGVYYQSIGSIMKHATDGRFPLNFSTKLVTYFDGPNDGLVADSSFPWGEHYQFLTTKGKRGISHGDMIDLNRENIRDFDVREFYVQLVHDLKKKGY